MIAHGQSRRFQLVRAMSLAPPIATTKADMPNFALVPQGDVELADLASSGAESILGLSPRQCLIDGA